MFYPKTRTKKLDSKLFKNPTSEYRGTPFWAWNCELTKEELTWQIDVLREMGFGGFHMHSRSGMATPYLSEEFMELVKACRDKAVANKMLCYLYDEDRWPSGAAGGLVTRDKQYRARYLLMTPKAYTGQSATAKIDGDAVSARAENGELLARFEVELDHGFLRSYRRLADDEPAQGNVWYAYLETMVEAPWYNNQTYLNTLDKPSVERFVEVTHEAYLKAVGESFGGVVPSIFTDEPQFTRKQTLSFADAREDVTLPFTHDLADTFRATYGEELIDHLPELLWDLPDGRVSLIRYHYHDHIAERFASAFADTVGGWCRDHGILLTGHMMEEPTLRSQTAALGDCMRSYRSFQLPGIDMLCDNREFTTAKQAQSAAHQYGCPGVLSELYGVTNWDYDFRGHKSQGDWQAALGVTVRVPHLSWVSMGGEAKRDYPASINYQSPWYREYPYVENYFARVNTALTRGKPIISVGVVHPVESYWLHWGPNEQTAAVREEMDDHFKSLAEWLITGLVDFNYISESLLPEQCEKGSKPLKVGKMKYSTVIVPDMETIRSSTLERLEAFARGGGRLIFAGRVPELVDAKPSDRALKLARRAQVVNFSRNAILEALAPEREIDIRLESGARSQDLITQYRQDGADRWLFIAHAFKPQNPDETVRHSLTIRVKGEFAAQQYDALDGEIKPLEHSHADGLTTIRFEMDGYDSLLIRLTQTEELPVPAPREAAMLTAQRLPGSALVELDEPNVLMLDMAEYSLDGESWQKREEILRIDEIARAKWGMPNRGKNYAQPWVDAGKVFDDGQHTLRLRFTIDSEVAVAAPELAMEEIESASATFDGRSMELKATGYFVDKAIKRCPLPGFTAGRHVLELAIDFKRRGNVEWCYLLGDFGVRQMGDHCVLTPSVRELGMGDWATQGLPFYAGDVTYFFDAEAGDNGITLRVPQYRGAVLEITLDGQRQGLIAYAPYILHMDAAPGAHRIGIKVYGNRVNAFGPVHNCDRTWPYYGPHSWHTEGTQWSYAYRLWPMGLIAEPEIMV